MVSGAALLLDIHRPAKPNGFGIVFIAGSGFQADPALRRAAHQGNADRSVGSAADGRGLHRVLRSITAARRASTIPPPSTTCSARSASCARTPRAYRIDGARLGGLGGSSGGNLIALAAVRAAPGTPGDADAVNREPATLQAIVLRAAVTDLRALPTAAGANFVVVVHGSAARRRRERRCTTPPRRSRRCGAARHRRCSSTATRTISIPYAQSVAMQAAFAAANVAGPARDRARRQTRRGLRRKRIPAGATGRTTTARPCAGSTGTCAGRYASPFRGCSRRAPS